MLHTCGSLGPTKIWKDAIGIECNTKKVLCSAEKSSVIWAEPHSRSSAKQFGRTECSVGHYYRTGLIFLDVNHKLSFSIKVPMITKWRKYLVKYDLTTKIKTKRKSGYQIFHAFFLTQISNFNHFKMERFGENFELKAKTG